MTAPKVSRRFYHVMSVIGAWSLFVAFFKKWEQHVPPSKHITLDGIDGGPRRPYLTRWHMLPRNRWFNVYLHRFVNGDDDRALHDHPWHSASLILAGRYIEHTAEYIPAVASATELHALFTPNDGRYYVPGSASKNRGQYEGFDRCDYTQSFVTGDFRKLLPTHRHLLELYGDNNEPCLTLFITGRLLRRWGFWCKNGFRDFAEYTAAHPTQPNVTVGCE